MAGPIYGEGMVNLRPQLAAGFGTHLATALGPIGKAAGLAFAATFAAGFALVKIGGNFEDAFKTIRVGTGATGEALEELKEDFRAVFGAIPTSMAATSTAIADLNTRLGLTGEPLQDLAIQFLELSRITGTDLSNNISSVTRAFGDWDIADQSGALDLLFRASQQTGASVDELSASLVRYGAPLRQLGFTFAESAAMIGKFEKEGVNAELVLGSMRIALGKMAREGEPAIETFQRVTEEIKNAGSASEANALALELFGARAGPDMAAAIREGRFEIDELVGSIEGGSDSILQAAEDTKTWRDSLNELGNRFALAVEPLAEWMVTKLSEALDWVQANWPKISEVFRTVWSAITTIFTVFRDNVWNPIITNLVKPFVAWVQDNWGTIRSVFETVWTKAGEALIGLRNNVWNPVIENLVKPFVQWVKDNWPTIQTVFKSVFDAVSTAVQTTWEGFQKLWSWVTSSRIALGLIATVAMGYAVKIAAAGAVALAPWAKLALAVAAVSWVIGDKGKIGQVQGAADAIKGAGGAAGTAIERGHSGALFRDEGWLIGQTGEFLVDRATTAKLIDMLNDDVIDRRAGMFDGAAFNFFGSPEQMVTDVGRRIGLEVRVA